MALAPVEEINVFHVMTAITAVISLATPFAVLVLGLHANKRKDILNSIDDKMTRLDQKVDDNQKECREDSNALLKQLGAFQREVAKEYPDREDLADFRAEVRDEIREVRQSIPARPYRPHNADGG